uniref:Uncharacterized protein n=1 Tax=viral metagenome TaxID=1070528 RepID=A0A6C0CK15_9ZZZZ
MNQTEGIVVVLFIILLLVVVVLSMKSSSKPTYVVVDPNCKRHGRMSGLNQRTGVASRKNIGQEAVFTLGHPASRGTAQLVNPTDNKVVSHSSGGGIIRPLGPNPDSGSRNAITRRINPTEVLDSFPFA